MEESTLLGEILAELKKLNAKMHELHQDIHHELREMKVRLNDIKL